MFAGVKPRWGRAAAVLLAVLLCAGLGGCLQHPLHHTRWEVLAYLEENFPGEKIKVSLLHGTEPDDRYSRTKWVWKCRFADMPDVVFHVSSSWWSSSGPIPIAGYDLFDDVKPVFWNYYMDRYESEGGRLDAWEIKNYTLTLDYSSMEQIPLAAEQFQAFIEWLGEQPHAGSTIGAVGGVYNLSGPLPTWYLDDRYDVYYESADTMVDKCGEMLKRYCAFYDLPCEDCTQEELQAYAAAAWPWDHDAFRLQHGGEQVPLDTFAGIGLCYRHFSFAGLYELLSRLGVEVEGAPERFSVSGADGCLYEFSYDFYDREDGKWYYIRDGEQIDGSGQAGRAPIVSMDDSELFQNMADVRFEFD